MCCLRVTFIWFRSVSFFCFYVCLDRGEFGVHDLRFVDFVLYLGLSYQNPYNAKMNVSYPNAMSIYRKSNATEAAAGVKRRITNISKPFDTDMPCHINLVRNVPRRPSLPKRTVVAAKSLIAHETIMCNARYWLTNKSPEYNGASIPYAAYSGDPFGGEWRRAFVHSKYTSSRGITVDNMNPGKHKSRTISAHIVPDINRTVRDTILLGNDVGVFPFGKACAMAAFSFVFIVVAEWEVEVVVVVVFDDGDGSWRLGWNNDNSVAA